MVSGRRGTCMILKLLCATIESPHLYGSRGCCDDSTITMDEHKAGRSIRVTAGREGNWLFAVPHAFRLVSFSVSGTFRCGSVAELWLFGKNLHVIANPVSDSSLSLIDTLLSRIHGKRYVHGTFGNLGCQLHLVIIHFFQLIISMFRIPRAVIQSHSEMTRLGCVLQRKYPSISRVDLYWRVWVRIGAYKATRDESKRCLDCI